MTRAALAVLALALGACSDWESLSTGHDAGPMRPAYCSSGVRDGDESDVDCGGACSPCEVAGACAIARDCQTRTCVAGRCSLTSTPPGWLKVGEVALPEPGDIVGTSPDGNIYVLGGGAESSAASGMQRPLYSYDPDTALLRSLAPLDSGMGFGTTFGPGGRLYALGRAMGGTLSGDVRAYDPTTDSWSADAPLVEPRIGFAAAGDETHVYAIGGANVVSKENIEVYSRDPVAHFMTRSLPEAWRGSGNVAAALDGLVYVFGLSPSMGIYDPSLDTWRPGPSPTMQRSYLSAVVGADRRIYSIGGGEAYDHNAWTPVAPIPTVARNPAARGRDGRIYVLGPPMANSMPTPLFAYGPAVVLTTRSVPAGGSLLVGGLNFASRAVVSFRWDDDATVVARAESDDTGVLLQLMVPVAPGPGLHRLMAIDDRSRYPVSVAVTVRAADL